MQTCSPPLASIEIQKKNAKILSDAKITTTVFKFFLLSLYAGEKKAREDCQDKKNSSIKALDWGIAMKTDCKYF